MTQLKTINLFMSNKQKWIDKVVRTELNPTVLTIRILLTQLKQIAKVL